MLRQLGVSVGFQFILMDIRHALGMFTIIILRILVTWCIDLQNNQSIATSVVMQQLPNPHATMQQKQTGVGKLT